MNLKYFFLCLTTLNLLFSSVRTSNFRAINESFTIIIPSIKGSALDAVAQLAKAAILTSIVGSKVSLEYIATNGGQDAVLAITGPADSSVITFPAFFMYTGIDPADYAVQNVMALSPVALLVSSNVPAAAAFTTLAALVQWMLGPPPMAFCTSVPGSASNIAYRRFLAIVHGVDPRAASSVPPLYTTVDAVTMQQVYAGNCSLAFVAVAAYLTVLPPPQAMAETYIFAIASPYPLDAFPTTALFSDLGVDLVEGSYVASAINAQRCAASNLTLAYAQLYQSAFTSASMLAAIRKIGIVPLFYQGASLQTFLTSPQLIRVGDPLSQTFNVGTLLFAYALMCLSLIISFVTTEQANSLRRLKMFQTSCHCHVRRFEFVIRKKTHCSPARGRSCPLSCFSSQASCQCTCYSCRLYRLRLCPRR